MLPKEFNTFVGGSDNATYLIITSAMTNVSNPCVNGLSWMCVSPFFSFPLLCFLITAYERAGNVFLLCLTVAISRWDLRRRTLLLQLLMARITVCSVKN